MNNKEKFFEEVEEIINSGIYGFSNSALQGLEELKNKTNKSTNGFTENGKKILQYMQEHNEENNNLFKAKDIGEGLFVSGRSVSGSIRKLITDGYVVKTNLSPVTYSLTDLGKNYQFDN